MRPGVFMPKFARKGNRMRQFIVASHAHFASGIVESIGLLSGERENVHALSMYVDGNEDLAKEATAILDGFAADDEVVVCTDLFGGSVNNEFTKVVQTRPNTHLVTNMNLPLLIQLLFVSDSTPIPPRSTRPFVRSSRRTTPRSSTSTTCWARPSSMSFNR